MKRAIWPAVWLSLFWVGCGHEPGPTAPDASRSAFEPVRSSTPLHGLGAAAELEDLSCDLFSDARIRFSDPGFIRFERVGMYVLLRDMPVERKRLRLWWDWDGEPNAYTDWILDDDAFEEVLEHEYTELNGESHKKVRIELTSESSPGHCVRVRHIVVAPEHAASRPKSFSSGSLTTTFASNDNCGGWPSPQAGHMFDVAATKSLTITSFAMNLLGGGTHTVSAYSTPGSSVGKETNAGAWTLLGTTTVTAQGTDNPTPVPIGSLSIGAGQSVGVYLFVDAEVVRTLSGSTVYTNAELQISNGNAVCNGLFGSPNANWIWNGTVNYQFTP